MREDYTTDTREVLKLARELIISSRDISLSDERNIERFYKFTMKLIIAFVLCVMIMGFCIVYALYQAYNYDTYPTIPEVNNTNITGSDNKIEKERLTDGN